MNSPQIEIATILSIPFEENTYIVRKKQSPECLVIDPGLEPDKIFDYLDSQRLTPAAILNTHGHADHIGGNEAIKARWPDCPLLIGSGDAPKLTDAELNLSAAFGEGVTSPPADKTLEDGEIYSAGGIELKVLAIAGHSAGHVVFLYEQDDTPIVFVGDVIFAGSIGRHDFPDGDFGQLRSGIHNKLFTLPDETVLLPGHGPATTVGREKQTNPFVGLSS